MNPRRLLKTALSRCATLAWDAWYSVRLFWYTTEKGVWIFASVVLIIVVGFGLLGRAASQHKSDREELLCLALNVYHEARGEPTAGQYAVAEVTMNRVASWRYPNTVCGVVYQKNWDWLRKRHVGAFSWTEFDVNPRPVGVAWMRAWEVAEEVYYQRHTPQVQDALHYHANYILPSWARKKKPLARIGRHVFYR